MQLKIDKQLVKDKFLKSINTYDKNAVVQKQMAKQLIKKLIEKAGSDFEHILEVGSGTGLLTREISEQLNFSKLVANDLTPDYEGIIKGIVSEYNFKYEYIKGDAEYILDFPENNNLIISNATFQWFDNIVDAVKRAGNILQSGGVIAFTSFGSDNFKEISEIENIGLKYPTLEEIIAKLENDFEIIYNESRQEKLYFSNPIEVLQHIKNTGVNSLNGHSVFKVKRFINTYNETFTTDKGVSLTYNPIFLILKKKS